MHFRILILFIICLTGGIASGATITVSTLADTQVVDGECTLREAIVAANSNTGDDCDAGSVGSDTVVFAPGLTGTISFVSATPLTVTESLTVQGPGASQLVIDALRLARVFQVSQGASGTFGINGVTVRNGFSSSDGAGILIDGATANLDVQDVIFDLNFATGNGGALAITGPVDLATIIDTSVFESNEADGIGSAIYIGPSAQDLALAFRLTATRMADNIADDEVPNLYLECSAPPCNIVIDELDALDNVGRQVTIQALAPDGNNTVTVSNSGFFGDSRRGRGDRNQRQGLLIDSIEGQVKVYNNSFKDFFDTSIAIGTGTAGWPSLVAHNTLIFNFNGAVVARSGDVQLYANLFQNGSCFEDGGTITSLGGNVTRDPNDGCLDEQAGDQLDINGDAHGVDKDLSGSPTRALFPAAQTATIDGLTQCTIPSLGLGDAAMTLDRDQAGNVRPINGIGDTAQCDVGAIEAGPQLTIDYAGPGAGVATISPPYFNDVLNSGEDGYRALGDVLSVTPLPDSGNVFAGFSGACSGMSPCDVTMDQPKSLTVSFDLFVPSFLVAVEKTGTGEGTVTSTPAGINCDPMCSSSFEENTLVALNFSTGPGSSFAGWSGDCSGSGVCQLNLDSNKSVIAIFDNPDVTFKDGFE